jgi:hypothetical protein
MLSQNPTTNYTSQILLEFEVHDVGKTKTKLIKDTKMKEMTT